jgi:hypothetical protein
VLRLSSVVQKAVLLAAEPLHGASQALAWI